MRTDPIRADLLRARDPWVFAAVRADAISIEPRLVKYLVAWLGDYIRLKQLPNQPGIPEFVLSAQHALAEAYARASGSRQDEYTPLLTKEFVSSGHEDWIGTAEAAAELGITADGVRWNCRAGNLHRRTVGRQMLISRSSIEHYKHRKAERTA